MPSLRLSASRLLAAGALLMAAATAPALAQQKATPNFAAATAQGEGKIHELKASPTTVHRGFFDASLKPVLTIDSGDIVRLWTATGNPRYFESLGVPKEKIPRRALCSFGRRAGRGPRRSHAQRPDRRARCRTRRHRGNQDSLDRSVAADRRRWASAPTAARCPRIFPIRAIACFSSIPPRRRSNSRPGVVVPAKPFWGVIGVAPPPSMGRVPSGPPNVFGGNMDNHDLQPGTSLFLPVHVRGALISIGDGHAVQGYGRSRHVGGRDVASEARSRSCCTRACASPGRERKRRRTT